MLARIFRKLKPIRDNVNNNFGDIVKLYREVANKDNNDVLELPTEFDDRQKFEYWANQINVRASERDNNRKIYFYGTAFAVGMAVTITSFGHASGIVREMTFANSILLTGLFGLKAAYHSLRSFQIRSRKMWGWRDLLSRPAEWLPHEAANKIVGVGITFAGLSALCGSAFAQTTNAASQVAALTTNSLNSQALQFLSAIFGGGVNSNSTTTSGFIESVALSTNNPVGAVLGIFSNAVMFVAISRLIKEVLHAVAHASVKGDVNGKYWATWSPVRIAIGTSMMVPLFNGFCGMSLVVAGIGLIGSNLADAAWQAYVNAIVVQASTTTGSVDEKESLISTKSINDQTESSMLFVSDNGMDVAYQFLKAETCYAIFKAHLESPVTPESNGAYLPSPGGATDSAGVNQTWNYGSCGQISFPAASTKSVPSDSFLNARVAAISNLISNIRGSGIPTNLADSTLPSSTVSSTSFQIQGIANTIAPMANTYESALRTRAAASILSARESGTSQIQALATQYGWLAAPIRVGRPIHTKTYGKKREHGQGSCDFGRRDLDLVRLRHGLPVCCVQSWRAICIARDIGVPRGFLHAINRGANAGDDFACNTNIGG